MIAHADGLVSLYGHLDDALLAPVVKAGDVVRAGDRLGSIGLTGMTTGPHLHFSVWRAGQPIDPFTLLAAKLT